MDFCGIERRNNQNQELKEQISKGNIPSELLDYIFRKDGPAPTRGKCMFGTVIHKEKGIATNEISKMFDYSRYRYLVTAKFSISSMCCNVMKKDPMHRYAKETGKVPMTAQMASESRLRTSQWLKNGCNGFHMKSPVSNPMSFWTEQDVLLYIKIHSDDMMKDRLKNHSKYMMYGGRVVSRETGETSKNKEFDYPICSVYKGKNSQEIITYDYGKEGQIEGQMDMSELAADLGIFDTGNRPLKTTGCDRTGCVLCGFGCHLESEDNARFVRLKETHPGLYGLLDVIENNGVTYREAIEWVNEHGNFNIKL